MRPNVELENVVFGFSSRNQLNALNAASRTLVRFADEVAIAAEPRRCAIAAGLRQLLIVPSPYGLSST
jgi:hypothetical protein